MHSGVKFIKKKKTAGFYTLHTDALDRLDDMSMHHKPHFPQITSVFKPSHNMVRSTEERFAMERIATRGFGAKKIAAALGVQEATTKRWPRRLRTATWRRATSGDRVVRRLECVLFLVLHGRWCPQTSASSAQSTMTAEHWPAKQVICG